MNNSANQIKATGKYLRISATKANRVLDQIRGKKYQDAKLMLQFLPYRSCTEINKILDSAVANAENNYGFARQNLTIKTAFVNQGPTMKRFQPRAQGRAFPIHKPTCHITVGLISNKENEIL
uniref:Large ribosomal subunit protein uL22c n=1 Tax=Dermonema virens TaxID=1077399 RepID=A0A1G4NRV0_9FLOR|nr:Ribosomal protein L22 [Dermonema virens]SCW21388.1 Ribosomal protein L22 [Dermonema virens]